MASSLYVAGPKFEPNVFVCCGHNKLETQLFEWIHPNNFLMQFNVTALYLKHTEALMFDRKNTI